MVFGHKDEQANVAGTHKPTIGEKIGGAVDSLVGKATHKPEKVAEGETKKTGNPALGESAGREQAIRDEQRREDRSDSSTLGHNNNNSSLGHNNNTSYGHDNSSLGHNNNSTLGHNNGVNPTYIPAEQQNVAGLNNAGVVQHDRTNLSSTAGGAYGQPAYGQSGHDNDRHDKPSVGEKLSGGMESMVGKATHKPEKVAEGEAKKTHDPMHAQQEASEVRRDNINRDTTHQDGSYGSNQYGNNQTGAYGNNQTSTLGGGYVGETAHQPTGAFNQSHTGAYDNSVGGNHGLNQSGGAYGQAGHGGAYDQDGRDKPSVGEKLSGGMSSMIGKATHNPEKVAEGEYKKTHDSSHAQQEAREVRHDNLERDGHNQTGGVYGQQNQAGGAYTTNPVGGNQQTGAYGSVNPAGGAYDGTNTGNRY